jgi:hypothetical protein
MQIKGLVTVALLLFVAASIVALIVKGLPEDVSAVAPADRSLQPAAAQQEAELPSNGVVVYYFHSNVRCPTCRNIESHAHEAIETGFARELNDGQLVWRVVNYERPENADFVKKYELIAPAVVVVEINNSEEVSGKNLTRVWELVTKKDQFIKYVQDETRAMLSEPST